MRSSAASPPRWRRVAAGFLWVGIWQVAAWAVAQPLLLPGPWQTLVALVRLAGTGVFWLSVGASFGTIVGAFLATFAVALVLGGAAASRPWLQDLIRPVALVLKATPVACVVVLLLLWLGSAGVPSAAVALVVFPAYYFSTLEGARGVDRRVREALATMGVGPGRLFLVNTWPGILPYLRATSQNAVGMAWKAGVAAELIAMALNTFGEKIYQAKLLLETPDLFAWTVAVVVLAFLCERVFCALLGRSGAWALRAAVRLTPKAAPKDAGAGDGLRLDDVTVLRGGVAVVESVSLRVAPGEALCLRGPSGRGKTSLLLAILGLLPVQGGHIERPRRVSAVFQEPRLVEELSMEDNVGLVAPGVSADEVRRALAALLPDVEPGRRAMELSGGQRRRVELVRAMLCPGGAVLLDEPFSGLDGAAHARALAFVRERLGGRSLLVATHDGGDARALGAQSLELGAGERRGPEYPDTPVAGFPTCGLPNGCAASDRGAWVS